MNTLQSFQQITKPPKFKARKYEADLNAEVYWGHLGWKYNSENMNTIMPKDTWDTEFFLSFVKSRMSLYYHDDDGGDDYDNDH